MGIRAVSAVAAVVGFGEALQCLDYEDDGCQHAGLGGFPAARWARRLCRRNDYDIATAKDAAREYNAGTAGR